MRLDFLHSRQRVDRQILPVGNVRFARRFAKGTGLAGQFSPQIEHAQIDCLVQVEAPQQASRQPLALVGDGVADLQPPPPMQLDAVEVLVELPDEQGSAVGIEAKTALLLVEERVLYSPRGKEVDHHPLGVDAEELDQVEDQREFVVIVGVDQPDVGVESR